MEPIVITAQDIENEWRPLKPRESNTIASKSATAWTRVVADTADIVAKLEAAPQLVATATVKSVMVSMIIRVLKNPDSARQQSRAVDDWSKSQTLDTSISTGEMYVSEYEHGLLNPKPVSEAPEYGAYVVSLGG
ncbi:hypothetical protein [Specibacter sp. NPDC078692]|uniref:hypothetical protein n=1 Tax=Specibacter sp. NPDC078692 TaxID=3155818 RepID=UPI0034199F15